MAGMSLRLARSPLAPKMTMAQEGAVGIILQVLSFRSPRVDRKGGRAYLGTLSPRPVTKARSAAATSATTGDHPLRGAACRNSRIVGYHGESVRSRSQRQSGADGSMTQTARPKAPV